MNQALLRKIPKVDDLLQHPALAKGCEQVPPLALARAVREVLGALREELLNGRADSVPDADTLCARIAAAAEAGLRPSLRPVLNGTGVVLHTNLGRACLSAEAVKAVDAVANYSTLEYNVEGGCRGQRYAHVERLLTELTGAESAMVVNNNAAAVLLTLSALTAGGEVAVSRGELVEIGGAFRVPEIMESCGALLKEVGATNKTRLADYERAIGPNTRALMKVHTSNYRIVGFTQSVPGEELARLAHERGLLAIEDLGGGSLADLNAFGIRGEPTVQDCVSAGMDVVCFSGDKLLGGPQAGILLGGNACMAKLKAHPLARAMRVDKMTLAALEATLRAYRDGTAGDTVPVLTMLRRTREELWVLAEALGAALRRAGMDAETVAVTDQVGGGAVPTQELPAAAVSLLPKRVSVETLEERLRKGALPVIGCLEGGRYLLHVRTLFPKDFDDIGRLAAEADR